MIGLNAALTAVAAMMRSGSRNRTVRRRLPIGLLAVLMIGGCAARQLNGLDAQLAEVDGQCAGAGGREADLTACQQRYEQLATQALAAARSAGADPSKRLAFYRIAAVAAFAAGPAGAQTVSATTNEGSQLCNELPKRDASAPHECAIVRLAYPLAASADLARTLAELIAKRDELRRASPAAQLPATDLQGVLKIYEWFQTEFDKVSWVRTKLTEAGVSGQLPADVDDQRRAIYCWALKAYGLAFDVEGTTQASLAQLTTRKAALRRRAEDSLGPIDCKTTPPTIALPR
jgi:hypothetical protein